MMKANSFIENDFVWFLFSTIFTDFLDFKQQTVLMKSKKLKFLILVSLVQIYVNFNFQELLS